MAQRGSPSRKSIYGPTSHSETHSRLAFEALVYIMETHLSAYVNREVRRFLFTSVYTVPAAIHFTKM